MNNFTKALGIAALCIGSVEANNERRDTVDSTFDSVEFNNVVTQEGDGIHDQILFRNFHPETSKSEIEAWRLIETEVITVLEQITDTTGREKKIIEYKDRVPVGEGIAMTTAKYNVRTKLWEIFFQDKKSKMPIPRKIISRTEPYETWTLNDPEMEDRRSKYPESARKGLPKVR